VSETTSMTIMRRFSFVEDDADADMIGNGEVVSGCRREESEGRKQRRLVVLMMATFGNIIM